jgi:hypothetical protein
MQIFFRMAAMWQPVWRGGEGREGRLGLAPGHLERMFGGAALLVKDIGDELRKENIYVMLYDSREQR